MKHQVVILAGGESSRFFPFNRLQKSFRSLMGKRIIEHTLESVRKTDPSEIIIVLSAKNFTEEEKILRSVVGFEDIKIVVQDGSLGQAHAILSAKDHIKGDFFVINPQQINFDKLIPGFLDKFSNGKYEAVVGSQVTENPQKYGIFDFDRDEVTGIVEKPNKGTEPSDKRVVGIYLFSKDIIKDLETTGISQYSLEETLNRIAKDRKVAASEITDISPSIKYPWDLLDLKNLLFDHIKSGIHENALVKPTAQINGPKIFIDSGAQIYDFAIIEGPAYIGKNAVVGSYCQVRGGTVLEEDAQIQRYVDVKNSIIGKGTHIHSGFIGDSVIGEDVRIGAGFIVANKRLDRGEINVTVKGEKKSSGKKSLGVMIGDKVSIGINASAMPGSIVGENVLIYPGEVLK